MTNYTNLTSDLYIHLSDLPALSNGEAVAGYKQVNNPSEYELISKYAFLPAIQLNENTFSVCAITK